MPREPKARAICRTGYGLFKSELVLVSLLQNLVSWFLSILTQLNIHFKVGPELYGIDDAEAENCRDLR